MENFRNDYSMIFSVILFFILENYQKLLKIRNLSLNFKFIKNL